MFEILKSSVDELYKKLVRVGVVFILNLILIFGIDRTGLITEIFTIFVPLTLGVLFVDRESLVRWKDILLNFLIYVGVFLLNLFIVYKYIDFLNRLDFISDGMMFGFNLITIGADILMYIFAMGFLYSLIKKINHRIAVEDMLKYFSTNSSKLIILFYGIILSLFTFTLVFYGLNSEISYSSINLSLYLLITVFICFMMLVFKNFVVSERKDEIICKLKEKSLGFYIKSVLGIGAGVFIIGIVLSFYFVLGALTQSIVLLIVWGVINLFLIVGLEILILNILIKINGSVAPQSLSCRKFFNMVVINIVGFLFIGVLIYINYNIVEYNINWDFINENPLICYSLLAMVFNYLGLIFNFQLLGVFVDKSFGEALKDSFALTSTFIKPKVIIIFLGEGIFLTLNILNGMLPIVIYFFNLIITFYLIEYVLKKKVD